MNRLGWRSTSRTPATHGAPDVRALQEAGLPLPLGSCALNGERKLKTDDLVRAVAETGGVIGIEAPAHTTTSPQEPRHSIESVMDHFEYCADRMGVDHVAFGPDTFFGDHVGLHKMYAPPSTSAGTPHEEAEYVEGLENPSEFSNVIRAFVARGYSDEDIEKAVGGNVLRALVEVWVQKPRRRLVLVSAVADLLLRRGSARMDLVNSVSNTVVVTIVGFALFWVGRGQFQALSRRFDAVDQRIDRLEERLDHRIDAVQASIDAIRSDLTQIALAVGVRPRAGNG
jgi:hypothetical protein